LQVAGVLGPEQFGDLSFIPKASLPLNAFVNQHQLQEALDLGSRVNVVVLPSLELNRISDWTGGRLWTLAYKLLSKVGKQDLLFSGHGKVQASQYALGVIHEMLRTKIQLADIDCRLDEVEPKSFELRTPRVFLDPPIERAATNSETGTQPILTYLATLLHAGTNATPYSMVTAAGAPWTPAGLRDDEVVVSQWLADDLHVKPGDEIAVSYFLPESGAKLEEATNTFRVHSVVPLEMPWADRTLMPDFPGIEKAESTRDWDAGFPLTYKIRPKDEDYWKQYRGTSKAFITLAAGQRMWGNRFGNLTAIRFPIPTNLIGSTLALTPALSPWEREDRPQSSGKTETGDSSAAPEKSKTSQPLSPLPGGEGQGEGERHKNSIEDFRAALEKKILANLKPEELGLRFEPVREQALKAAKESQDFGGLFLGFSCFLIAAALLLMAMLFQFGLEQRAPEIGTLLALGFTPKQVRKLLLREGVAQAFIGGVLGAVGGIYFAKAMLHGLNTQWNEAVGGMSLSFHMTAQTLVIGLSASVAVSGATLWLTLRKFVQREPRDLLVGEVGEVQSRVRSPKVRAFAVVSLAGGLAVVAWAVTTGNTANAGAFFGAGALVLIAGLGFVSGRLATGAPISRLVRTDTGHPQADQEIGAPITLGSLALCSCARRRKRSLGTVAMLACGSFLIVSIGVFRLDANRDATERSSGTGGFALIGETTMPVVHDLNSQSGRDFFALSEVDLQGVNIVAFRVREGDEASCLNLNAAQKPRLLGVKPELMAGRFAFAKDLNEKTKAGPWAALQREHLSVPLETNEIPAIGDANSIQWAMKKKVGDTIDYVDERGQPFKVRIVGAVANSILQGQLIIDEAEFVQRFPGEAGYRMFLLDAPTNRVAEVSATLSRALQDVGLELTPAPQRLAQFNAVQNTYLGTFQVLGGLGLLLGSVGLGIVVLRNVLERRGELAVLMAVGFRKTEVQRLLLLENGALLAAGLGVGVIAAAVAVLPAVLSPETRLPVGSLAATLIAILVNGLLWTWLATRLAVRGDLLRALRNE
jgi:ABC-type antimicrobial peptide transport system permease subunit